MKYKEYIINEKRIEFHNSIIGKETVLIDKKVISQKYSILGTEHKFSIDGEDYHIKSSVELFKTIGVKLILSKNGEQIEKDYLADKNQFIAGLVLGFITYWILDATIF